NPYAVVHHAVDTKADDDIVWQQRLNVRVVRALTTNATDAGTLGQFFFSFQLGRNNHQPRAGALGGIIQEQARGLQPPLTVAQLANVDDVARFERHTIEYGLNAGMGVLTLDLHIDPADAVALAFGQIVNEVYL